jgi:hypothetical protein
MGNSYQTADLSPGMVAFYAGVYEVAHFNPEHSPPHEVLIAFRIFLPKCLICADSVRFSLKAKQPEPLHANEFFPPPSS